MRRWLARQMGRPWVARITCGIAFVFLMYWLRVALIALRDTGDRTLVLGTCIPGVLALIVIGFWLERRGY